MGIIQAGYLILPLEGVDTNDMEALAAAMPGLSAEYFIGPFLAHALGTFVGALVAAAIAATHKMKIALGVGAFFLLGGIAANMMLPGPTWFTVADLVLAYIPMAWLGGLNRKMLRRDHGAGVSLRLKPPSVVHPPRHAAVHPAQYALPGDGLPQGVPQHEKYSGGSDGPRHRGDSGAFYPSANGGGV